MLRSINTAQHMLQACHSVPTLYTISVIAATLVVVVVIVVCHGRVDVNVRETMRTFDSFCQNIQRYHTKSKKPGLPDPRSATSTSDRSLDSGLTPREHRWWVVAPMVIKIAHSRMSRAHYALAETQPEPSVTKTNPRTQS